jgi:hypothetical protein
VFLLDVASSEMLQHKIATFIETMGLPGLKTSRPCPTAGLVGLGVIRHHRVCYCWIRSHNRATSGSGARASLPRIMDRVLLDVFPVRAGAL